MDPGPHDSAAEFQQYSLDALDSLPPDLRARMSNVEIVIEDEPPAGKPLLGLYQGVPLTRRGSAYGAVLPDKITIFRRPIERHAGSSEAIVKLVQTTVVHEFAHHFGISDAQLDAWGWA